MTHIRIGRCHLFGLHCDNHGTVCAVTCTYTHVHVHTAHAVQPHNPCSLASLAPDSCCSRAKHGHLSNRCLTQAFVDLTLQPTTHTRARRNEIGRGWSERHWDRREHASRTGWARPVLRQQRRYLRAHAARVRQVVDDAVLARRAPLCRQWHRVAHRPPDCLSCWRGLLPWLFGLLPRPTPSTLAFFDSGARGSTSSCRPSIQQVALVPVTQSCDVRR